MFLQQYISPTLVTSIITTDERGTITGHGIDAIINHFQVDFSREQFHDLFTSSTDADETLDTFKNCPVFKSHREALVKQYKYRSHQLKAFSGSQDYIDELNKLSSSNLRKIASNLGRTNFAKHYSKDSLIKLVTLKCDCEHCQPPEYHYQPNKVI
jgi:hypothetical protein